jgi:hypothetical protein
MASRHNPKSHAPGFSGLYPPSPCDSHCASVGLFAGLRRLQRLCNRDPNVRQYEALLQDLSQAMTLTIHPNEAIRVRSQYIYIHQDMSQNFA